jgi:Mrp family chromosome partitioning ATPase
LGTPRVAPDADCGHCDEACGHPRDPARPERGPADGSAAIRRRLLVLSGTGGVGKRTVAVNLAMGFGTRKAFQPVLRQLIRTLKAERPE